MQENLPIVDAAATGRVVRSTAIEWTDHTWNPFIGCSPISAGCKNCYAMRTAEWLGNFGNDRYAGLTRRVNGRPVWTGEIRRNSDAATHKPLLLPAGSKVFVNSMSDFGHPDMPDTFRDEALNIMRQRSDIVFQVLTKRPDELAAYCRRRQASWPAHVWAGATVEDHRVTARIAELAGVPAAIRFLSVEPMTAPLGPVDLSPISWVITGGESGPGRRPCRAEWVRHVRDQCADQQVAFFHKQWGHASDNPIAGDCPRNEKPAKWIKRIDPHGKGGALLDGRYHFEFPAS